MTEPFEGWNGVPRTALVNRTWNGVVLWRTNSHRRPASCKISIPKQRCFTPVEMLLLVLLDCLSKMPVETSISEHYSFGTAALTWNGKCFLVTVSRLVGYLRDLCFPFCIPMGECVGTHLAERAWCCGNIRHFFHSISDTWLFFLLKYV